MLLIVEITVTLCDMFFHVNGVGDQPPTAATKLIQRNVPRLGLGSDLLR
jgi:hypothetical protein